ncbi:MAG: hypothetical protein ACRETT_13615, partial [Steroidobacteraceae bacterium]
MTPRLIAGALLLLLSCAASAETGPLLAAEQCFADFLDARGAVETIDAGALREIDGKGRSYWQRLREQKRRELTSRLRALRLEGLPVQEVRAVQAMRATFEELAGASMTPNGKCRDARHAGNDLGALKASLYACFDEVGNHIRFEGKEITRGGALQRLQEIDEPARRRTLFLAMAPLWEAVNGDGGPDSPYRRLIEKAALQFDRNDAPAAAAARSLGVSRDELERWLLEVLDAWRALNPNADGLIEPWNFRYHYAQASRALNTFIPRNELETLNERFFRDLGADPRALGTLFDLEPRPGKAPIAYADAVRIGRSVADEWRPAIPRISANYDRGGLYTLNELVHETGHAVHIAAIRARPAFFWPDTLFMEAFADVPSWSVFDPAWQQTYLGRAVSRADSLREQYALVMLDVAWGLFELRMLRDPAADPNAVWTAITQRYLSIAPHPEWSWWAVRAQLVDAPGYMVNYAAGAVLTAQLRRRIRDSIGPFDAGNPRWFAWLSEQLLMHGADVESSVLLRRFLGRGVSAT